MLVSLWKVSDEATSILMKLVLHALRRAQEDLRPRKGFSEPKYWTAFQLVGAR
ncbi:MAG TPA: CHAT domain-containing protein [Gemmatimonadales bacterium]|nr:CHAT domain-containing protein [Gemmatimonadales bacterium]